ncbi:MAG: DNA mismatch repair protein MutS [Tannerellaceae bacterium]|jgi:hypothetical protein|nr:DNA mismatch repair protein MutS [Tannerellaceae bacterium]
MEDRRSYYRDKIDAFSLRARNLQQSIHLLGSLRLFLVIAAMAGAYLLRGAGWGYVAGALSFCLVAFAVLMVYHNLLSDKKAYADALAGLCSDELRGLDHDFSSFDGAPDKADGEHSFSLDLDIFGERSLFQSVNRTVTAMGRERLADMFIYPLCDKVSILRRQEAVRELATLAALRQDFYVTGALGGGKEGTGDRRLLSYLLDGAPSFGGSSFWRASVWVAPVIWVVIFALLLLGFMPPAIVGVFFVVSALTAYAPLKKINRLHVAVCRLEKILLTYSGLIRTIENRSFTSEALTDITCRLTCRLGTASAAIRRLSAHIGILDQRGTFTAVLLNIFTFRDIRAAIAVERWKAGYGAKAEGWLDALADFDALSSLAGFAFNHPLYTYPAIGDTYFEMSGKDVGHPLLPDDICVKNDVAIGLDPSFLIITGANMAGKSTYLRTVGVNFLLSMMGLPACASELTVSPAALVTSLRTSDSLTGHESYFFAELKRLKMIIDRLRSGERLFIILDEILKGTNSVDKQKGSFALVGQLLSFDTRGIIATHDLALGDLAKEFPHRIRNHRFEATITDDTLTFSYKLEDGIAQNMNACFLMQKMGMATATAATGRFY